MRGRGESTPSSSSCLHLAPQTTTEGRERGEGGKKEGRNAIVWTNTKVLCRLSIPEEVLGPHNAVNGFTGRVAYGTARERLGSWL